MRYRFEMSNQPPFAQLSVFGGLFPNAFSSPAFVVPAGVISPYQFDAEQPTVYQWNLNIQRELGRDLVLSAGYVGSRGVNLETRYSLNVRPDFQIVNGQKFFPALPPGANTPRVNPNFASLNLHDFSADSYYHALQLNLTKRFSSGLQFETAYTLSKSIDTASATESVFTNGALGSFRQDPFDPRAQRTPGQVLEHERDLAVMPEQLVRPDDAATVERAQQLVFVAITRELANGDGMPLRAFDDDASAVAGARRPIDDSRATFMNPPCGLVARELECLQRRPLDRRSNRLWPARKRVLRARRWHHK